MYIGKTILQPVAIPPSLWSYSGTTRTPRGGSDTEGQPRTSAPISLSLVVQRTARAEINRIIAYLYFQSLSGVNGLLLCCCVADGFWKETKQTKKKKSPLRSRRSGLCDVVSPLVNTLPGFCGCSLFGLVKWSRYAGWQSSGRAAHLQPAVQTAGLLAPSNELRDTAAKGASRRTSWGSRYGLTAAQTPLKNRLY